MGRLSSAVMGWLATAAGAAGWFLASTALLSTVPHSLMLAVALLGPAAYLALVEGREVRKLFRRESAIAAAGGVLAFWAAPALALSQRASDTPPGTETLLFTTVSAGVLTVVVSVVAHRPRTSVSSLAACAVAAAGAAALLANWERPSSFSPLVRWPERELLMLLGAAAFAVGTLMIVSLGRGSGRSGTVAVLSAALVSAAVSVPAVLRGGLGMLTMSAVVLLVVPYALFAVGWIASSRRLEPQGAASALIVVPVLLTSLILAERAAGVRGTDPIVWQGAVPAIIVCLVGVAALLGSTVATAQTRREGPALRSPLVWAGMLAAVFSAISLSAPAISQAARGTLGSSEAFRAQWLVLGYQSGAGWAAVAAGLCALATAWEVTRGMPQTRWLLIALAGLVCAAAVAFLGDSTFATWNSWVPGDIQHAYGTEYAQLSIDAVWHPIRIASLAFSVLVIAVSVSIGAVMKRRPTTAAEEERS